MAIRSNWKRRRKGCSKAILWHSPGLGAVELHRELNAGSSSPDSTRQPLFPSFTPPTRLMHEMRALLSPSSCPPAWQTIGSLWPSRLALGVQRGVCLASCPQPYPGQSLQELRVHRGVSVQRGIRVQQESCLCAGWESRFRVLHSRSCRVQGRAASAPRKQPPPAANPRETQVAVANLALRVYQVTK